MIKAQVLRLGLVWAFAVSLFTADAQTITDTATLRSAINTYIVHNTTREISETILNRILNGQLNVFTQQTKNGTHDTLTVNKSLKIPSTDTAHAVKAKRKMIYDTLQNLYYGSNGTAWLCMSCSSGGGGSGTVTSIATNTGTGITGGTITNTGTLAIDTSKISTRAWRDKLKDSLAAIIGTKQNAITTGTTGQYFRGDLSLATFPTVLSSIGLSGPRFRFANNPFTGTGNLYFDLRRVVYILYGDSAFFWGDSYTLGALSTNYLTTGYKAWVKIVATILGLNYVNEGVAGQKTGDIVNNYYSTITKPVDQNTVLFYCGGANNIFRTYNGNSLEEMKGCLRVLLANQFLGTAQAASTLTASGFTAKTMPSIRKSKSAAQLSGTAMESTTVGNTLTGTITGDNLFVSFFGTDDIHTKGGTATISSDGVVVATIDTKNKVSGRNDSLFNNSVDSLGYNGVFINHLGAGSHAIVITTASLASGGKVIIDFIGTLAAPNNCKAAVVSQLPYVTSGYETFVPPTGTYKQYDTAQINVIDEFNGWPATFAFVKDFSDSANDIVSSDGLHYNDAGHQHWAQSVMDRIIINGNKPMPAQLYVGSTILNSGTDKGVLYNDNGVLNHDASYFAWDKTNHRLGIGFTSPSLSMEVKGSSTSTGIGVWNTNSNAPAYLQLKNDAGNLAYLWLGGTTYNNGILSSDEVALFNNTNNKGVSIGTYGSSSWTRIYTDGTERLRVDGSGNFMVGTSTTIPSAIGNFSSTTKGFLFPKLTTTQRDAISSPATGLIIYNTTTNRINWYDASAWNALGNTEADLSLSDNTTNDASTSKHGLLKKLDNNSSHYMDGTGTWSTPLTGIVLQGQMGNISPSGGQTYYAGGITVVSGGTTANRNNIAIPITGTIKAVYVTFSCGGTLGSSETSSIYLRLNNTTDILISNAVTNDAAQTKVSNTSLSQAVTAGDFYEIKWPVPASYSTPPTNVRMSFVVLIQ